MKQNATYYTIEVNFFLKESTNQTRKPEFFVKLIEYPIIPRVEDEIEVGIEDETYKIESVLLHRFNSSQHDAEVYIELKMDYEDFEATVATLLAANFKQA